MQLPRILLALVATSTLALSSCGNDAESGAESSAVKNHLRECGLVTGGKLYPAVGDNDVARCQARCVADTTCEELEAVTCLAQPSDRLLDCQAACFGPQTCDGGEQTYDLRDRCDDQKKCDDGADEANCPAPEQAPRYCEDSGDRIWFFQRCDGVRDCQDGTDEKDCPEPEATFLCKASVAGLRQEIPYSAVCDLKRDCADGSDEGDAQGCAKISCGN